MYTVDWYKCYILYNVFIVRELMKFWTKEVSDNQKDVNDM